MSASNAHESPQVLRLFPEKLFYKIGEASRLVGVEAYVLRYWESEFPFLNPRKSRSGQRIYSKKDIDILLQIRRLLYEERYTIDGVRKKLGGGAAVQEPVVEKAVEQRQEAPKESVVAMVRERLRRMLDSLS